MKRDEIHTKSGYKSLLQALQKVLQWILIKGVRLYQLIISPWLGPSCRHSPTCSTYMIQAIKEWGAIRGFWLGIKRIAKCHPWGTAGFDPVPKRKNKNSEYSP